MPANTEIACLTIGLTGGIASGKSAVAQCFRNLGVTVIDADAIARELVAPGQPALAEIVAAFGTDLIKPDGTLDRARLRQHIFTSIDARMQLEAILHPRVRSELLTRARTCTAAYCMLVIPLLVESDHDYDWLNRILVVDVPKAIQIERLMQRDAIAQELATRMLAAQASREQRLAVVNDIIENTLSPQDLDRVVAALHRRYLALANTKHHIRDM